MKVFLGYSTALNYWIQQGRRALDGYRIARITSLDDAASTQSDLKAIRLESYGFEATQPRGWPERAGTRKAAADPTSKSTVDMADKGKGIARNKTMDQRSPAGPVFHVLVPSICNGRPLDGFARHRWSLPIPDDAFRAVAPGVLVSTPEFSFVQLAGQLSFSQLVLVGHWLCAAYRTAPTGDLEEVEPLCSVEQLRAFANAAKGCFGARKARRALAWVANGARSPMEVNTCMLAALPLRFGGYGLGLPALNHQIDAKGFDRRTLDRPDCAFFLVDLYWEREHVGVEYEGSDHYERDRIRADKRRINCLIANGETILTVTYDQISNYEARTALMNQLAMLLGKSFSAPNGEEQIARAGLIDLLFGGVFSL